MQSFGVRLEATVFGAKQFERLERVARKAGVEIGHLKEQGKKVEINGKETTAFAISLNKLTKEARKAIIEEIKLIQGAKNLTKYYGMAAASFVEFDDSIEDITKGLKAQQRELDNAAKAAERFEKATANALIRANLLQKQRIENQNTARELNKATDAAEYNRRRDQRQLDDQEKFNRQQQLMQQRHAMAMQRINAYHTGTGGPFGTISANLGNGSILKVFAYDAIRRTLTNMYQTMGRIGDTVQQWVVDSIEFNDELDRAKTMFTGFALIGRRNKDGTPMTIDQAQTSSKAADREAAALGEVFAQKALDQAMAVSLKTGQDFSELISASRQTLPDTISKIKQKNGESPLVKEGANLLDLNKFLLESASVFKMLDPSKKLTWHMVALGEAIAGSSGSKKDTGMQAIMSLMRRENIKVQAEDALALSKAVNSGNIPKMREVLMQILDKAGQSQAVLENMYKRTLAPRVEAVKTQFKNYGANFTRPLYEELKRSFIVYSDELAKIVETGKLSAVLKKAGASFSKAFAPFFDIANMGLETMINDPEKIGRELERVSLVVRDFNVVIANLGMSFFNFMRGFLGMTNGKEWDISSIIKFTTSLRDSAAEAGEKWQEIMNNIMRAMDPITTSGVPAMTAFTDSILVLTAIVEPFLSLVAYAAREFLKFQPVRSMLNLATGKDTTDALYSELNTYLGKTNFGKGLNNNLFDENDLSMFNIPGQYFTIAMSPLLESAQSRERDRLLGDYDRLSAENARSRGETVYTPPQTVSATRQLYLDAQEAHRRRMIREALNGALQSGPGGVQASPGGAIKSASVSPIFDAMQMVSNVGWNPKLPKHATTAPPQVDMSGMHTKVMQIVSDEAKKTGSTMVEAIKTGRKPIEFRSNKVEQKIEINLNGMTVNANNAQDFIDQIIKMGRGKANASGYNPQKGYPLNPNFLPSRGG